MYYNYNILLLLLIANEVFKMLTNKKLLPINKLEVGMLSADDIKFEDRFLLAKGAIITELVIKTLNQNHIVESIEIYVENDSEEISPLKVKTSEKLENTFNEFSASLDSVFNNLSNTKTNSMDELRTFSKKIQDEFIATGAVIQDIVFYSTGDTTIYRHSVNVSAISFILGKWLGLNENEVNLLTYSAILHDFGKTKINNKLLNKKLDLTSNEKKVLKSHAILGYNFVKNISYLDSSVSLGILMHHEKIDGSGYPLGLKGKEVHKFAKIIAIADMFDNINSHNSRNPFEALKIIQEKSFHKLDHTYCNMFLNHVINYCMGETVVLNDERRCKIIKVYINDLTHPLLLDDNGFVDLKKDKNLYIKEIVAS